jgi:NADH-quinone oxidoreductase subunit C
LERVEPEEFSRRVSSRLGEVASGVEVRFGEIWVSVSRERVVDAVRILRTEPELGCDYFTFLCGVDWEGEGMEVVISLYSIAYAKTVLVKVKFPAGEVRMPTITGVFGGANWHEREAAEMFGIIFDGHPNPKNLYLSDDFVGHPMLKSFKLASRTYKPWPGAKDPDEAGGR